LGVTRTHVKAVVAEMSTLRRDLQTVNGRIDQSTTALAQDKTQLRGVEAALSKSQADMARQGSSITDLQNCLGGVEEALNALSVGDQASAVAALNAVSASCNEAVASSG
jgi:chromosome segregation ATPase